jgi:hypothetical protein
MTDAIGAALVAQLADDPDDAARLAILADRLQTLADPRGELIALSLAMAAGNRDPALAQRRGELMHALAPALGASDKVTWGIGFIRSLALQSLRTEAQLALLAPLWQHPSLAVLAELSIGIHRSAPSSAISSIVDLLPTSLRALRRDSHLPGLWPDLGALARLHRLERLAFSGSAAFAELAHPHLVRLELELNAPLAELAALSPRTLPRLTELEFRGTARARDFDYLIDVLAATGWLARITELGLVGGDLTSTGIDQLEAGLSGRRLAALDLDHTRIYSGAVPRLAAMCDKLVAPWLLEPERAVWVENTDQPEWGHGQVVRHFDGKVEIDFEHAGKRVFRGDARCLRYFDELLG